MNRFLNSTVSTVAALSFIVAAAEPALAQRPPEAHFPSAPAAAGLPRAIVLDDIIYEGHRPRAIGKENVRRDAPVVTYEEFKRQYRPRVGPDGELLDPDAETLYRIIAGANEDLCGEAKQQANELVQIDGEYVAVDQDYVIINAIYEGLPKKLKKASKVMTIWQAAQTGALCALSLGLYCIAAVAVGIGNIFANHANLKLQLANVQLSLVNIRHSRANIRHSRTTVRMDALWLRAYVPYCRQYMPGFSASDSPLIAPPPSN